jgi:general secretion pathway protein E
MGTQDIQEAEITADQQDLVRKLSFSYAQSHGVLLDNRLQPSQVFYRRGLKAEVLMELRRSLGESFQTELLDDGEFQRRLTQAYQKDNNEAAGRRGYG